MTQRASSLRLKLTLWFLLVFSAVQVALLLLAALVRREAYGESLVGSASLSAQAMAENILIQRPAWTGEALQSLVPEGARFVLGALRDENGRILAAWNVQNSDALPFEEWERAESGSVSPATTRVASEQAQRIAEVDSPLLFVTLHFGSKEERYFLQVAVRDRLIDRLRGPLFYFMWPGLPIGTAAALVAAWLIAGRAVAPLRRLSDAARSVSPENLAGRIQVETTDDEVSKLQGELNSALTRLQAGYEAQEQFISNVSHELKTPIAVLLAESQVVRMGAQGLERYVEFAGEVERETEQLGRLVDSFLGLARAGIAQGVPASAVPLNDLVLDSVRSCRRLAERRRVRLVPHLVAQGESPLEPELRGDAELLRTMIDNLVRNAIRHSPSGAAIEIEARIDQDGAEIRVRDRGPGIPEDYLDRVFDRFVRVPSGKDPGGGSGLGLDIARRIAELHRGTIGAANEPTGGCTFTVRIPLDGGGPTG